MLNYFTNMSVNEINYEEKIAKRCGRKHEINLKMFSEKDTRVDLENKIIFLNKNVS